MQRKARLLVCRTILMDQAFAGHFIEQTNGLAHLGFGISLFRAAKYLFDAGSHHRSVMTVVLILHAALPDTLDCRFCMSHRVVFCSAMC